MFVKPANGLKIREPISLRVLPDEGAEVQENGFWYRRLRDGDVIEATAPSDDKTTKASNRTN